MSINSVTAMDVDSPSGAVPLKRSSSAPMINDIININTTMTSTSSSSSKDSPIFNMYSTTNNQPRTRRFSTSYSPVLGSPGMGPRLTPRISQLRQEECVEISNLREVAHERDIHSAMQMSQSWEDLTLVNDCSKSDSELKPPKDCKLLPLQLNLSPCQSICSSPSPTRLGFQPFTSGITPWKALSPSPTRKPTYMTRRSLSPIAMRPSQLGPVKRKLDEDIYASPRAKRINSYNPERSTLLIAHNNTSSPLTGSLSSVGTPESLSSADSPGYNMRSVDSPPPNRPLLNIGDEPMHEERTAQESPPKVDQIMASVDQSPS